MRIVVIGITLCILFVGGLVVSVKIGGGSNLHNMDAFLILLAVVTVYALFDRFVPDFPSISVPSWRPGWLLLLFVLAIPTFSVITISNPLLKRDTTNAFQRLALVQYAIDRASTDGGQVLFITQRHLLTFEYLHAGQLVPDYEKVFLMEMAMSNNVDYLEQFHSDLENHRFSLIVSEPLANVLQKNYSFAEENNAWVIAVVQPLLKEYRQVAIFKDIGIELLEPK